MARWLSTLTPHLTALHQLVHQFDRFTSVSPPFLALHSQFITHAVTAAVFASTSLAPARLTARPPFRSHSQRLAIAPPRPTPDARVSPACTQVVTGNMVGRSPRLFARYPPLVFFRKRKLETKRNNHTHDAEIIVFNSQAKNTIQA